jgi:hypothetical protein
MINSTKSVVHNANGTCFLQVPFFVENQNATAEAVALFDAGKIR